MGQVARRVIVYVLYFLIAVVVVGAIVIALTSKDKTEAPSDEQGTQQTTQGTNNDAQAGSMQVTRGAGSTITNNSGSSTATSQNANSGELAESGPGETIAVFVASSLVGYMLYRRKLVKQNS